VRPMLRKDSSSTFVASRRWPTLATRSSGTRRRAAAGVFLCASVLLFAGRRAELLGGTYVYVSLAATKKIAVFELDANNGHLTAVAQTPVAGEPGPLTHDPAQRFLFASIRSKGELATFRLASDSGKLRHVATIPAAPDPAFLATDRTGRYLLTAYYEAGKVAVHRIQDSGDLEEVQWVETSRYAHAVQTDPENRFVFVPHTQTNVIFQFRFDARTGRLSPSSPARLETPERSGPRQLYIHPTKPFVYFDNEQGNSVTAYRLDDNHGTLKPFQTLSTLPDEYRGKNSCARLEGTPDGRFIYAANRGHDSIAGFSIDAATGTLTALGSTPTAKTPRGFAIDPQGKYLVAAGQNADRLVVYRIDPKSGKLERLATYPAARRPWWVHMVQLPANDN
jgi:6-phosphogluconolactonase